MQAGQQTFHCTLGVVLYEAHVGNDRVGANFPLQAAQRSLAQRIGGDLRGKIGQVLFRVARRMSIGCQPVANLVFQQQTVAHDQHPVGAAAFLVDMAAVRRHRAGADAADIGVVRAAGGEIAQRAGIFGEDRRNHGDIGQMRAAGIGRVDQPGVARAQLRAEAVQDGAHRIAHAAQMHRNMRRVGDQIAGGVEQRTGEIQPLADVHRAGAVLQRAAHVFGDAHEAAIEQGQPGRVRARGIGALQAGAFRSHQQVATRGRADSPTGLQHQRRTGFDDQRRSVQGLADGELIAPVHRRVQPSAIEKYRPYRDRLGR